MFRLFYSFVFLLALPMALLNSYLKGRPFPIYRNRWREHFGLFDYDSSDKTIWVHAVSVGESLAAIPIIRRLMKEHPEYAIVVTTTTPTGAERILSALGDSVKHLYSPYDYPWVVNRFLTKINPCLTIIMETELWPNFMHFCRKRNVPIIVANARLSARSARRYGWLPIPTHRRLFQSVSCFACQNEGDAQRFKQLGALEDKVSVTGSIKFDLQLPVNIDSKTREIFSPWKDAEFVWVAGSTHVGEDEPILSTHRRLLDEGLNAKLILVPRHPERFDSVSELVEQRGFKFARRSKDGSLKSSSEVFVCDSMGEMMYCYKAADVAFVAGSFIERGGHNPLEPAALSKPVISGKHVFNFADVYKNMVQANAAQLVSKEELFDVLLELHSNIEKRELMGRAGLSVVESNRGAVTKTIKILNRYLNGRGSEEQTH
ncbi:lipid IV(A) 3-deoxy-D-manno-octulosonic acid transferase [Pleionea sediminis]|uniref:lipid IV(A) 3-deoxy-D-manno-octulosonic acid transferase n=1 Tax=Pleionea sediminis TaxID=2569479 RepID=UPI0013DD901E|nr:lipid IV(A) 3-deoxy-D-manno-octulosonic acid transferase [Pleionea sediminis]